MIHEYNEANCKHALKEGQHLHTYMPTASQQMFVKEKSVRPTDVRYHIITSHYFWPTIFSAETGIRPFDGSGHRRLHHVTISCFF